MSNSQLNILINALWRGKGATGQARSDIQGLGASSGSASVQMAALAQRGELLQEKMRALGRAVAEGAKTVDQATREYDEYRASLVQVGDAAQTSAQKSEKGTSSMVSGLGKVTIALGAVYGAARTAQEALEFGEQGAEIQQLELSFERLNRNVLQTPNLLRDLQGAAKGTIRDTELMAGVLTLVAGQSEEMAQQFARAAPQLLEIAKAAQALNPSLGDTAYLYESIALGIKRNSPLILDNLGIVVKVGDANERYAASLGKTVEQLSAQEKQVALLNAVLETGGQLIEQAGGSAESLTDPYQKLRVQTQGLLDTTKRYAAEGLLPLVRLLTDDYGDAIDAAIRSNLDFEASLTLLEAKARQLEREKSFATWIRGQNDEIQAVQAELVLATARQTDNFEAFNASLVEGFGSSFAAWENFIEGIRDTQLSYDIGALRIMGVDQLFELTQAFERTETQIGATTLTFEGFVNVLADMRRAGATVEDINQFADALAEAAGADYVLLQNYGDAARYAAEGQQALADATKESVDLHQEYLDALANATAERLSEPWQAYFDALQDQEESYAEHVAKLSENEVEVRVNTEGAKQAIEAFTLEYAGRSVTLDIEVAGEDEPATLAERLFASLQKELDEREAFELRFQIAELDQLEEQALRKQIMDARAELLTPQKSDFEMPITPELNIDDVISDMEAGLISVQDLIDDNRPQVTPEVDRSELDEMVRFLEGEVPEALDGVFSEIHKLETEDNLPVLDSRLRNTLDLVNAIAGTHYVNFVTTSSGGGNPHTGPYDMGGPSLNTPAPPQLDFQGVSGGGGQTVNIQPGAIVVSGVSDANQAAEAVIQKLEDRGVVARMRLR